MKEYTSINIEIKKEEKKVSVKREYKIFFPDMILSTEEDDKTLVVPMMATNVEKIVNFMEEWKAAEKAIKAAKKGFDYICVTVRSVDSIKTMFLWDDENRDNIDYTLEWILRKFEDEIVK